MKKIITLFITILFGSNLAIAQMTANTYKYNSIARKALRLCQQKKYQQALEKYEEAFQLISDEGVGLYNAACCASLMLDYKSANSYLSRSIESGYIDKELLLEDKDFLEFKKTKYWKKIVKSMDKQIKSIETDFSLVAKMALTDLVPYAANGKWGYLNKLDKSIIVPAKYKRTLLAGDCLKVEIAEQRFINVSKAGEITIFRPKRKSFPPPPHPPYDNPKVDSTEGFIGFRVNKYGVITHVASIYDATEWEYIEFGGTAAPEIEILGPFKIKDKWHAIVQKDGKWGVIDESGNILEKVTFQYKELRPVKDYKGEDVWFYFIDSTNTKGFINSLGEVKFYGAFDHHPFSTSNVMKLAKLKNNKRNGIVDFTTMNWVIEPIEEDIIKIDYTYEGTCNKPPYGKREKVKDFYFLIRDIDKKEYYIGEQGESYKSDF